MRKTWILAASAAAALVLAGCGSTSNSGSASSGGSGSGSSSSAAATDLATWKSPVGTVVVDGTRQTVYMFDKDTAGSTTSACTGVCIGLWPALTTTSSSPSVSGVTADVGTLPTADGKQQVTLDGHRLYTFSGDSAAEQINGQGYMGLWWAAAPDGSKVTATAPSSASASASSSSSAPAYSY